jgi:NAD(P)-dependent dehydrogenase (short-subunit alcohol dehydrogenase family)
MRFKDKVIIVTGGAGGIGLATAKLFGKEKGKVVIADLDDGRGTEAAREVNDQGSPDTFFSQCNVADEEQVRATVKKTLDKFGRLDVVVNNAGLMVFKPIPQLVTEDWEKILQVDLLGAFYFTKQAFLHMKNGGSIVNVSSIHAEETTPLVAPYAAAKAALLSFTRSSSLEGKPKNIRVNAVLPGAVETPMLRQNPNIRSGIEVIDPKMVGKPEDVAQVIVFLASAEASFIQGASIRVDGGRLDRL